MKIHNSRLIGFKEIASYGFSGLSLIGQKITQIAIKLLLGPQEKDLTAMAFKPEDRLSRKCHDYRISYDLLKKEKVLNCFLNEYLLEKLEYFGYTHTIRQQEDELKLPYTHAESLEDQCLDTLQDIKEYYAESKEKKRTLRIINPANDYLITEFSFETMSLKEFRAILKSNHSTNITILEPTEWLSLEELADLGVIELNLNEEYTLTDTHILTSYGFMEEEFAKISYFQKLEDGISHERIDTHINFCEKQDEQSQHGTIEICVHKPTDSDKFQKGHASLKLTDAQGFVYSVGFYPENTELMFEKQKGEVVSPDPYIFFSKKVMQTKSIKFEFTSKSNFKLCFEYLLSEIQKKDAQISYDSVHENCAAFAGNILKFAQENQLIAQFQLVESKMQQILRKISQFFKNQIISIYESIQLKTWRNLAKPIILPEYLLYKA